MPTLGDVDVEGEDGDVEGDDGDVEGEDGDVEGEEAAVHVGVTKLADPYLQEHVPDDI